MITRFPTRNLFIFFFSLIAAGLGCALPIITDDQTTDSIAPATLLVSITDPLDGEAYPVSAGITVRAEAVSDQPIRRVELWADGERIEVKLPPENTLYVVSQTWVWTPTRLGPHNLMVRAEAQDGEVAFSNSVNLNAVEDPGFRLIVTLEQEETLDSLAARYGVSLESILNDNPGLDPSAPLVAGQEIRLSIPPAPPTQGSGPPVDTGSPLTSVFKNLRLKLVQWKPARPDAEQGQAEKPASPSLQASTNGCGVELTIQDKADNESGFFIYRLNPGANAFSRIATLNSNPATGTIKYSDQGLFGAYQYYVAAFDPSGEAASNLDSAKVSDPQCAGVSYPLADLIPPQAKTAQQVYLYVSLNNGDWQRFPQAEFTFLDPGAIVDLGQVAGKLAPNLVGAIKMRGEIWGWQAGELVFLGNFEKDLKNTAIAPLASNPAGLNAYISTQLEIRGKWIDQKNYEWGAEKTVAKLQTETFRWNTTTGADKGVWQVSSKPFPKSPSLNPACLLMTGDVVAGGPNSKITFPIDLAKIPVKTISISSQTNAQAPQIFTQLSFPPYAPPYSPQQLDLSGQIFSQSPGPVTTSVGGEMVVSQVFTNLDPCAAGLSPSGLPTYYVRVIPMNGEQPAGNPSNQVIVQVDTSGGQIQVTIPVAPYNTFYDVQIIKFNQAQAPDFDYAYCVVVVKNPFYGSPIYKWGLAKPGDVVCPDPHTGGNDDGFLSSLGKLVEAAVNFVSDLYSKLSDYLTELVEKLNPFCIQAKFVADAVGKGEKEVKDACHFIAKAAVEAAKVYVGLPPSLPNYDELTNMGKDYVTKLAAEELEAQGIPCPDECKDLIKKGIDYSLEQVKNSQSNSSCMSKKEANENGIEPLCAPDGVITKPDPRAQVIPATAEIKITRLPGTDAPGIVQPASCAATISGSATNDSHIGKSFAVAYNYSWKGEPISGALFNTSLPIPNLVPGQSLTTAVVLEPVQYWVPGHLDAIKAGWKPAHFDDWYILYSGAMATINAGGSCLFPNMSTGNTQHVTGNSIKVGPLGEGYVHSCEPFCPK